jgi:hypothetical protein
VLKLALVWGLSINVKLGRLIVDETRIIDMDDRYIKAFKSISDGIKNNRRNSQSLTRECIAILDDIIRPAIRQAQQHINIKGEGIDYNFGEEPFIRTRYGQGLYFVCRGDSVEVTMKIGGTPSVDIIQTRNLSEELVFDKIVCFFKMVYNLTALEQS